MVVVLLLLFLCLFAVVVVVFVGVGGWEGMDGEWGSCHVIHSRVTTSTDVFTLQGLAQYRHNPSVSSLRILDRNINNSQKTAAKP